MENNKKGKKYYSNNKKYYYKNNSYKKAPEKEKITYDKLVNVRNSVDEIEEDNLPNNRYNVLRFVCILIILMAIIFGSLLLFHLI